MGHKNLINDIFMLYFRWDFSAPMVQPKKLPPKTSVREVLLVLLVAQSTTRVTLAPTNRRQEKESVVCVKQVCFITK